MSTELEALRKKHEEDLENHAQVTKEMETLQARHAELLQSGVVSQDEGAELQAVMNGLKKREADLVESLKQAEETHAAEVQQLKTEHEEAIRTKEPELDSFVVKLKEESERVRREIEEGLREEVQKLRAEVDRSNQESEGAIQTAKCVLTPCASVPC